MSTRIRLQRHGKKGKPFFHIVVADQRSKRDGRFIEKLGTYNPNLDPAVVDLNFESALDWVKKGASPSDTARAILSYKGVMLKHHLDKGVVKGALTQEQADKKFEAWVNEKEAKIAAKAEGLDKKAQDDAAAKLKAEKEKNEARAKEIAAKNTPEPEEAPAEEKEAAPAAAEAPAEEAPKAEEVKEEAKTEAPAEEAPKAEEKPAEEPKKEEPKAEEKPAEEPKKEEPKAEEKSEEEPKKAEDKKDA